MVGNRRPLKLSASIAMAVLAGLLFIFLVWSAQTDAQGAIGLLLFFPVLVTLLAYSIWLCRAAPIVRNLLSLLVVLPIALFYLSSLGGFGYKPFSAYSKFVMNSIGSGFQNVTGVTPYEWGKERRRIHLAAQTGNVEALQEELDSGVDVNLTDAYQQTPLYFCAEKNQLETCRILLARGADVHRRKNSGWTPLKTAQHHGFTDMVAMLKAAGATDD